MEENRITSADDRAEIYEDLLPQLQSLISDEGDIVANLANISAALKQVLPYVSWVGFYLMKSSELIVGPFQGKVACTRIKIGSGVCGTAAEQRRTIIVPNVYEFPGHIFCDADSKSEIVVPLLKDGEIFGVLDLDSTEYNSFNEVDARNLELICEMISAMFAQKGTT